MVIYSHIEDYSIGKDKLFLPVISPGNARALLEI